jgi:hypothetical protein
MEYWGIGVLGYWGIGVLGYWGIGVLGYWGAEETPAGTDNNSLPARTSEVSRAE